MRIPSGVRVALVIPALDEAQAIGEVVCMVPAGVVDEVVVIDNGSTDGTGAVAQALGARVVREERRGYGSACLAGLRATERADILVYLDGDRSDDPGDLRRVLTPILNGSADLVLGSRLAGNLLPGALPPHQRIGNWMVLWVLRLAFRVRLTDIGSFRAIRRERLLALDMRHPTYGWPLEMVIKAAKHGYRIAEVPITYHPRLGVSKVGGTWRGSLRAATSMLAIIVRYRRGL